MWQLCEGTGAATLDDESLDRGERARESAYNIGLGASTSSDPSDPARISLYTTNGGPACGDAGRSGELARRYSPSSRLGF
jgi:hypothetical protein